MRNLHEGTTAQFMVNGELLDPCEIASGIRQGCPLAPLLFILAAEVLGLALAQTTTIQGIPVSGDHLKRDHLFSAFVDDSTVFVRTASQVQQVMEKVPSLDHYRGCTSSLLRAFSSALPLPLNTGKP